MSETTTLLRAGATDLVLRMAEAGTVLPDMTLDNPVQAIGEVSRDITGRSLVRLARGRQMSALDIQREYLARAKDFADSRGADAVSRRVLGLWERVLDAVGAGNLDAIAREIDWVIKYQLTERYRAEHDLPLTAPQVAQADLAYHDIRRGHGLYYQLQRSGAVERTARATSTSSRRNPSRRPPAATGRRADPVPPGRRVPDLAAGLRVPGQLAPAGLNGTQPNSAVLIALHRHYSITHHHGAAIAIPVPQCVRLVLVRALGLADERPDQREIVLICPGDMMFETAVAHNIELTPPPR